MYRFIPRIPAKLIGACLLGIYLSACSFTSQKPNTGIDNWQQHVANLSKLDQWQLEGKLGYRDSNDGGSAWLNWHQNREDFNVTLNGPFGTGTTRITGTQQHAQLQRAGHDPITASSPAALTEQLFGWQWPVEQLQFWARGIPAPNTPQQTVNHNLDGTLAVLEQSNWTLKFSNYQTITHDQQNINDPKTTQGPSSNDWILPGKIKGQKGEYHFTLIIKSWQPKKSAQ